MIGHISAALIGRDMARRAGVNGMLGAVIGLAGSIALRKLMPTAASAVVGGIARKTGLDAVLPRSMAAGRSRTAGR